MSYTPGPWRAVRNEVHVGKRRICSNVNSGDSLGLGADYERAIENARLIAAAPELLDALNDALELIADQEDVLDSPDGGLLPNRAMILSAQIREILTKATWKA